MRSCFVIRWKGLEAACHMITKGNGATFHHLLFPIHPRPSEDRYVFRLVERFESSDSGWIERLASYASPFALYVGVEPCITIDRNTMIEEREKPGFPVVDTWYHVIRWAIHSFRGWKVQRSKCNYGIEKYGPSGYHNFHAFLNIYIYITDRLFLHFFSTQNCTYFSSPKFLPRISSKRCLNPTIYHENLQNASMEISHFFFSSLLFSNTIVGRTKILLPDAVFRSV